MSVHRGGLRRADVRQQGYPDMVENTLVLTRREAVFFVAVAVTAPGIALADSGAHLKVRLLATSDLHCYLEAYDYYHDAPEDTVGLVRIATLVKAARIESPNALLFDNGDLLQGNPLGDLTAMGGPLADGAVHPVIKAMNAMEYDAATPGNHDFNYGLEFLDSAIKGARFPYVLANVDRKDGASLLPPYNIIERNFVDSVGKTHKVKIGVLGLVTPQIMMWDKVRLDGRVTAADIIERARKYAPEMRAKGADLVVALCHSGFNTRPAEGMDENAAYYLTEETGVDAIITGHQHRIFPDPSYADMADADVSNGNIHQHPTVMPGFYGSHLGVVDIDLVQAGEGWRIVGARAEARPIYHRGDHGKITPAVDSDSELAAIMAPDHQRTLAYVRQPIGRTTRPINTFFANVGPDAGVAIVNTVQRWAVAKALKGGEYASLPILSAAAPFRAGGSPGPDYYTDIPAGEIAIKNVADLYLYPNTLQAVRVTGAQVREWLEASVGLFRRIDPGNLAPQMLVGNGPSFNCDTISGVTYKIDLTRPARYDRNGHITAPDNRRIADLAFGGKPIADDAMFIVATNNYRASGGGSFPGLDGSNVVLASPDIMQNVIADYIRETREITPAAEPNWGFVSIAAPVDIRFQSSPKAKAYLEQHKNVIWIGPGENGFDLYRLDLNEA
jgi:2',3'-cyclic-nucleotide 2'-phosphodiesterase/3'-nucleotidase